MSSAAEITLEELGIRDPDLIVAHAFDPVASLVREIVPLDESDLEALKELGPEHSQVELKHIKAYHHMVALRLARGDRYGQVAAALGLTGQTITRLMGSPQFVELVETYRQEIVDKVIDVTELMGLNATEALMAIHERLVGEERDAVPMGMLLKISKDYLDRTGHSPVRRTENAHRHFLDSESISRIKDLHPESRRWNDPLGAIAADSHEEDSIRNGALSGAAAVFAPARQTEKTLEPAEGGPDV